MWTRCSYAKTAYFSFLYILHAVLKKPMYFQYPIFQWDKSVQVYYRTERESVTPGSKSWVLRSQFSVNFIVGGAYPKEIDWKKIQNNNNKNDTKTIKQADKKNVNVSVDTHFPKIELRPFAGSKERCHLVSPTFCASCFL